MLFHLRCETCEICAEPQDVGVLSIWEHCPETLVIVLLHSLSSRNSVAKAPIGSRTTISEWMFSVKTEYDTDIAMLVKQIIASTVKARQRLDANAHV